MDDIEHGKIDRKIRGSEWYTVIPYETKRERHTRRTDDACKRSRMVRKAHNLQREPLRIGSGGENRTRFTRCD